MKKLLVGAVVVATLSLGACGNNPTKGESTYANLVAEVAATQAKAKKEGFVWKQKKMKKSYADTFLAKAKAAMDKGDEATAIKYANKALIIANGEVEQANTKPAPAWLK